MRLKSLFNLVVVMLLLTSCEQDINKKADVIHREIISIDTHTDTPLNFLEEDFDIGQWNNFD